MGKSRQPVLPATERVLAERRKRGFIPFTELAQTLEAAKARVAGVTRDQNGDIVLTLVPREDPS